MKTTSEFGRLSRSEDGYDYNCKICSREKCAISYLRNTKKKLLASRTKLRIEKYKKFLEMYGYRVDKI